MRKVFLDDLPRHITGTYSGKIDWEKSIGSTINFVNEDISGKIKILDYNKTNQKVKINYEDEIIWFSTSSLLGSKITRLTKRAKQRKDFKYEIGDIINRMLIIDKFYEQGKKQRLKKYKYKCLRCGYIGTKRENNMHKSCPICANSNRYIDKDINSIKITHPHIYNKIIDSDADKYSFGSSHKVHWKCPFCNGINYSAIKHLTSDKPVGCRYCGDGISYPEKVLYNVLSFVSDTYEIHKNFSWSDNKEYDAFDSGIIIEIHGSQHYLKSFEKCGGKTLEEERENDLYKLELATNKEDVSDYVVIKAFPEDFYTIKHNILNSKLTQYYDFNKVDWDSVKTNSEKSLVYVIGNMYKNGCTRKDIIEQFKIHKSTLYRYLCKASDLGICEFKPDYKNETCSHKVKCKNTGEIFRSENSAAKWCGLKSSTGISKCIRHIDGYKTAGIHPITKERLEWESA